MKFYDLVSRLKMYYEETPSCISQNFSTTAERLQDKHKEYRRIRKATFIRNIRRGKFARFTSASKSPEAIFDFKAYECLLDDDKFINSVETKLDEIQKEALEKDEISEHESEQATLKDTNEVNNLITTLYMKKQPQVKTQVDDPNENKNIASYELVKIPKKRRLRETNVDGEIEDTIRRKQKNDITKPTINFDNFACDDQIKEDILRRIYYILSPSHFLANGKTPPRGFLLHGPPGCGKTQLVYAIAGELNLNLLKVTSTEIVSGVSGESESNIRDLFDKAIRNAPCILFIDEIEAISQRRENASKDMERRIVTQLLSCFDDLALRSYIPLVVIGATNSPDSLDSALRRASRFDQEIPIGIPDVIQRKKILQILSKKIRMNENVNLDEIVLKTPGYVGADINALIDEAIISSLDRQIYDDMCKENVIDYIKNKLKENAFSKEIDHLADNKCLLSVEIRQDDFDTAIRRVQPSAKREGFATVPDVSWNDIGALSNVRDELQTAILAPVKYAAQCELFNFTKPPGILLVGPPGCGKTLLAKAIARESGVNFISVKGPELLNMYVGESERAVRGLFQRARNSKPCVIFFDEIDAICVKRSDAPGNSGSTTRIVNQMLTEMDGLESRKGVFLMAASNRPDIIDGAILRPGRLDKIIYVGLPTAQDRFEILKTLTKNGTKPKLDANVNLELVAYDNRCDGFTGADLSALVREASEFALKEFIKNACAENEFVKNEHFEMAFNKIKPSVSSKDFLKYEKMKELCINLK